MAEWGFRAGSARSTFRTSADRNTRVNALAKGTAAGVGGSTAGATVATGSSPEGLPALREV